MRMTSPSPSRPEQPAVAETLGFYIPSTLNVDVESYAFVEAINEIITDIIWQVLKIFNGHGPFWSWDVDHSDATYHYRKWLHGEIAERVIPNKFIAQ